MAKGGKNKNKKVKQEKQKTIAKRARASVGNKPPKPLIASASAKKLPQPKKVASRKGR